MHPDLDQEFERQSKRLGQEVFNPVEINSISDIKKALHEFDPAFAINDITTIATQLVGEDRSGAKLTYNVQAKTSPQNKRAIMSEGFRILKERQSAAETTKDNIQPISVNGRLMAPPTRATGGYFWVDPLIKRWLGGYRDGLFVCWNLRDGLFKYDVFEHKLFKSHEKTAN